MRGSLFRQQALEHQRPTLVGNTLAARPLSFRFVTGLAIGFAAAAVLFACFGEYTQKARVTGYLAPDTALIKVYAPAPGTLIAKHVTEGQHVRRGDPLFDLSADRTSSTAPLEQQPPESERRLVSITAPAAGRVSAIIGDRGLSADPRSPVLSILPGDAQLRAQLLVPSSAIGSVHVGDRVRVRYRAFPSRHYGDFGGSITEISKTLIAPSDVDGPVAANEPVYRVTVALERQTVVAGGTTWPLQPGMQLEADVPLVRRRLIEWMFEPLLTAATGA